MTIELLILYCLATLTVVLKDTMIQLLSMPEDEEQTTDKKLPRSRSVYNAIRHLVLLGEITETTATVPRKNKKPLRVDYLSITKLGLSRLREKGYPEIPWASELPSEIGRIVGSGITAERIATRYCRMSTAALISMLIGSAEVTLSPDEGNTSEGGKPSLNQAVTIAKSIHFDEIADLIDDDTDSNGAPFTFVPALTMKRALAEKYGSTSDNEKVSGQCAGAIFCEKKVFAVYVAMPHSQPTWKDASISKKDIPLIRTYARDILRRPIEWTFSAILLVPDAATFADSYALAERQVSEKDRAKFSERHMRLTIATSYNHFYVVPITHKGMGDMLSIITDNTTQSKEAVLKRDLSKTYLELNNLDDTVLRSAFGLIDPRDNTFISVLPQMDVCRIEHLFRVMTMYPDKRFGALVPKAQLTYYQPFLGRIRVFPLDPVLEEYNLLEKHTDLFLPQPTPPMQIQRDSANIKQLEREMMEVFGQRMSNEARRHIHPNGSVISQQPSQNDMPIPVITGHLFPEGWSG